MTKPSITTVIYHRVNKSDIEEYRSWQRRISAACKQFDGYQDTQLFEPGMVTHNDCEFVIVFRFASRELLRNWIESDIRAELLQDAERFTIGKTKVAFFSGLEHWFTKSQEVPRYKMVVVTFFSIWPLVHFVPPTINQFLHLGTLGNEVVSVAVLVLLMSYAVLPLACRLFVVWLKP